MGQLVKRTHQSSSSASQRLFRANTKWRLLPSPARQWVTTLLQRFESPQMLPIVKAAIHQCYSKHPNHAWLCNTTSFLYNSHTNSKALAPPCSEWGAAIASQMVNDSRTSMAKFASQNCYFPGMQAPPPILVTGLYPFLMSTIFSQPLSPSCLYHKPSRYCIPWL